MNAAFTTEGKTTTQSALLSKSCGTSSGISRISLRTVPLLFSRSSSFTLSAGHMGVTARKIKVLTSNVIFFFMSAPFAWLRLLPVHPSDVLVVVLLLRRWRGPWRRFLHLAHDNRAPPLLPLFAAAGFRRPTGSASLLLCALGLARHGRGKNAAGELVGIAGGWQQILQLHLRYLLQVRRHLRSLKGAGKNDRQD